MWGGKGAASTETVAATTTAAGQEASGAGQPAAKEYKYTVYFISHGGPGDPWWGPVIKGAELAGDLLGVKVIYQGPEKFSVQWLVNACV